MTGSEIIRKARETKGYTLRELGRISGISSGEISQIENDPDRIPTLFVIKSLSKSLDIDRSAFVETYFGQIDG